MIDEVKVEEVVQSVEAVEAQAPEAKPESNKEYNLRILRERAEKAEARMAEMERQRQYEQQRATPPTQMRQEDGDEDIDIDDESYIEGKHLKKYIKAIKAESKQVKQQLQEYAAAVEAQQAEQELNARFPDAKEILTEENIKNLAAVYPQDYKDIMSTPNLKTRAKLAYLAIKNQEIATKYAAEDRKIAENKLKPRSAASVPAQGGDSPLSKFEDYGRRVLSEAQKDEIMRRVQVAKTFR